jgi:transposase
LQEIIIFIEYTKGIGICPQIKEMCSIYDFRKSRRLRHLDIFDYGTYIDLRITRIKNTKDKVLSIELDFADTHVCYTYLFEAYAIKTLLLSKNHSKTAEHLDISYDIVHSIMHRAVSRGLAQRKTDDVIAKKQMKKMYILKQPICSYIQTKTSILLPQCFTCIN